MTRIFKGILLCALSLVLIPQPAYAYIDPGTGSNILQVLLAFIIAIPFVLKTYWKRIKLYFVRNKGK